MFFAEVELATILKGVMFGLEQSTGGRPVTVDQLPGGRASVCELDGDCGRDFKLCRQTVF